MKAHPEVQHAEKWREYDQSSHQEKEFFFKFIFPFKSTVNSHFSGSQTQLEFSVKKDIVDVLIDDMLFDPSGDGEVASSQERSLAAFTELTAVDKIQDSDGDIQTDRYGINIVNTVQFNLTVEYLAVGVTF